MTIVRENLKQQLLLNWNTFYDGFKLIGHKCRAVPGYPGAMQLPLKQNGRFSKLCEQHKELRNTLLDDNIVAAGYNILKDNSYVYADVQYTEDCIVMHLPLILPDNDKLGMEFEDRVERWRYNSITTHLSDETYYGFNQSGLDRVILHVVAR